MLPAKAAGSLEKSTVQGGNCDLWWLQAGASRLTPAVHSVCFCPQAAAIIPFSKFLVLLEVGQAIQLRKALELIAVVVTGGLVGEMKTLLGGGSWNSSAVELHQ